MNFKNLGELLINNTENKRGITFLKLNGSSEFVSYERLYNECLKLLSYFNYLGVNSKDEIVFQIKDNKNFITCFWTCMLGGFVPVPVPIINNEESRVRLNKICNMLDNPWLITDIFSKSSKNNKTYEDILCNKIIYISEKNNQSFSLDEVTFHPRASDTAIIQFSSGSTGNPKGVILTHENILSNLNAVTNCTNISKEDSYISWLPLTHDFGLIGMHITPMILKSDQFSMATSTFLQNPILWMDSISKYKVTVASSPNFGYKHFLDIYNKNIDYKWDLDHVKYILDGAEPISVELCNKFLNVMNKYKLKRNTIYVGYGMAESSFLISTPEPGNKLREISVNRDSLNKGQYIKEVTKYNENCIKFVELGISVGDCKIRICDDNDESLKEGMIGSIQIKGTNVTKGYYKDKKTTEESFTNDGWFKTGDLGFIKDGKLFVTGREKEVVFVNGQNFYLYDIDRIIMKEINDTTYGIASCGIYNNEKEQFEICVFIEHVNKENINDLIDIVKMSIFYKLGIEIKHIYIVDKIPRTSSGKIQRFKLEKMINNHDIKETPIFKNSIKIQENSYELTNKEKKVIDIIKSIINVDNINIDENLFDYGIDSLKGARLIGKINKEFNIQIDLKDLYNIKNIKELLKVIEECSKDEYKSIPKLEQINLSYDMSPQQKRMFILGQVSNNTAYNVTNIVEINEKIDIEKINNALNKLVNKYEILRTSFENINGKYIQNIHESDEIKINIQKYDTSLKSSDLIISKFIKNFNLNKLPLFRIGLIKFEECKYWMIFDVHHIIADGTSLNLLMDELISLYTSEEDKEVELQYKDYSVWYNDLTLNRIDDAKKYWINTFKKNIPVLNMPIDFKRPKVQSFEGKSIVMDLDLKLSSNIKKLCKDYRVSLNMVLFSAYYILLSKYTNQEDIVVGCVFDGRIHADIEKMIGMFVNTIAIRSYPNCNKNYIEFLNEVKNNILNAQKYQNYQLDDLMKELNLKRDISRNPLFDTMFVFQNMEKFDCNALDIKRIASNKYKNISKFDITLFAENSNKKIQLELEYSTKLFKNDTMKNFLKHYVNILEDITHNPNKLIKDIDMIPNEEMKKLINTYNNTYVDYPKDKTIYEIFEECCKKYPKNIAVDFEGENLTYKELNEKSNKFARILLKEGVGNGKIVPIILTRSIEYIISVLAVLKTGAAFLPIDINYPKDRIEYMIKDTKADIVITENKFVSDIDSKVKYIFFSEINIDNCNNNNNLGIKNKPNDLVYIIYTSGSTGKPKGVMIEHKGLVNYIWWAAKQYTHNKPKTFALYSSIAFDLTITSLFTPLVVGGTIKIYAEDNNEILIRKIIKDNKVDIIKATPSHLKMIEDMDNKYSKVESFIVGGEDLKVNLARKIYDSFDGNINIYNEYGPTETVVGCMIYKFDYENDMGQSVPIGRAADNVKVYILDNNKKPVYKNVPGELYVSGDGVCRGYLNREELTKEKFILNPFESDKRMYKTGDLAKWDNSYNIIFLGRKDDQVKIRGYRIETGEIEKQLMNCLGIKEAVVLVKEDEEENKNLCAYLNCNDELNVDSIRQILSNKIPEYMIPAYFYKVDKIPLTNNGKVDKKALMKIQSTMDVGNEYKKAVSEKEIVMSNVWQDVLGVEKVGVNDNFFTLGGDSIKAIQVAARLKNNGIQLNPRDVLVHQTINQILLNIEDVDTLINEYEQGVLKGRVGFNIIQRWFFKQKFSEPNYYNQSVVIKFKKAIKKSLLEKAFKKIIEHHDGLRVNVDLKEKSLYFNNNHLDENFNIEIVDLNNISYEEQLKVIKGKSIAIKQSFDITTDILIKPVLFTLSNKESILLITAHHLVVDGVSWRIILEDLYNIYNNLECGSVVVLPEKTASIKEWYKQLKKYANTEQYINNKKYWINTENDEVAASNINTKYKFKNVTAQKSIGILDEDLTSKLIKDANKPYSTKPVELIIAAAVKTISKWTGYDNVILELESHGRNLKNIDISRTVGWFTSMYPIVFKINQNNLGEQIKNIKEKVRSIPNDGFDYGIMKYVEDYNNDFSYKAIRFNYLGEFSQELNNDLFNYCDIDTGSDISPKNDIACDIEINCLIINKQFQIQIVSNSSIVTRDEIIKLKEEIINNLKEIINYLISDEDIHFTSSDFDAVEISEEDLDILFD